MSKVIISDSLFSHHRNEIRKFEVLILEWAIFNGCIYLQSVCCIKVHENQGLKLCECYVPTHFITRLFLYINGTSMEGTEFSAAIITRGEGRFISSSFQFLWRCQRHFKLEMRQSMALQEMEKEPPLRLQTFNSRVDGWIKITQPNFQKSLIHRWIVS